MKKIVTLILLFIAIVAWGATPAVNPTQYVSPSGNDNAQGNLANPLATITKAFANLNGSGTIVVRGGNYFGQSLNLNNSGTLKIINYPSEVPRFYGGISVASNTFTLLSNGIFSATMSASFSNAFLFSSNSWRGWPATILLVQTNVPFGSNVLLGGFYTGTYGLRENGTNHCEHTPLFYTNNLSAMTNLNQRWFVQGDKLFVKFANSNIVGGLYIASTNPTECFVYGGNPSTDLFVKGIRTYFYMQGFDFSQVPKAEFVNCAGIGSQTSGFYGDANTVGAILMRNCEGGLNMFGLNVGSANTLQKGEMATVEERNCFWHENMIEGSTVRGNTVRFAYGSVCYGGSFCNYGFIDDGSSSTFIGCSTYSNIVAGFQAGNAAHGTPSYQHLIACDLNSENSGIAIDDSSVVLRTALTSINSYGVAVNVSANPTTHYVKDIATFQTQLGQINVDVIGGAGTTAANYVRDDFTFGTYADVLANSFYIPAFATSTTVNSGIPCTFGVRVISGPGIAGFTYDGHLVVGLTNATPASGSTVAWMVTTNYNNGTPKAYAIPMAAWP